MNPISRVEQDMKNAAIGSNPRNRLYMAGAETLQNIQNLIVYADETMQALQALSYLYPSEVMAALPQPMRDRISKYREATNCEEPKPSP